MRKKIAVLLTSLACMVAALTVVPAAADAYVYAGSCAWPTTGQPFWSPTYGRYFVYTGHSVINGYYYRAFYAYATSTAYPVYYVVYCG